MDPLGNEAQLLKLLQSNFLNNYNSNRVPLGLWVHAPWFTSVRCAAGAVRAQRAAGGGTPGLWWGSHASASGG